MNDEERRYFELTLDSLCSLARWCADCAGIALPLFEKHVASDARPREAIEAARIFATGGKRTAQLRTLSLAAFADAREAAPAMIGTLSRSGLK